MCQKRGRPSQRINNRIGLKIGLVLLIGGILAGVSNGTTESVTVPKNAATFELEEVSIFDIPESIGQRFIYSVYNRCESKPDGKVDRYPESKSDNPLYGTFQIGASQEDREGGFHYAFAVDESEGTGKGYDRMYIDVNLNGDLTDDSPCRPVGNIPDGMRIRGSSVTTQVCLDPITLRVRPGDDSGHQLEVMPRCFSYGSQRSYVTLMPTKVHMGHIQVGEIKLDAILGYSRGFSGLLNHPETNIYLLSADNPNAGSVSRWYGGEMLKTLHRCGDTFYHLSTTPNGDKLFVWPYQGPIGVLAVKPGSRDVEALSVTGSLTSQDAIISLTEGLDGEVTPTSGSYTLPAGDYRPMMMNVRYGKFRGLMLPNSHADGSLGGRSELGPPTYGIKIRPDKPFVIDFSSEPKVIFASPAKGYRIELGDQLSVKAVLIDPSLDVMFRQIRDTEMLNPKVTIARSDGEVVAEGVMPFG